MTRTFIVALIAVVAVVVLADNTSDDAAMLEAFAERPECMTMLSRVYYATTGGELDELKLAKFGAKKLMKRLGSSGIDGIGIGSTAIWRESHWGQQCDADGAVLRRIGKINVVPYAAAFELDFMAQLRAHREHDLDVTADAVLDKRNLVQALGDDGDVPSPGRDWIWQDYALAFAGVPLCLALVAVTAKAFSR